MTGRTRLSGTAIIWSAFTLIISIIAVALIITGAELDLIDALILLAIFMVLTVAVNSSTRAIWHSDTMDTAQQRGKIKRSNPSRVERLIDRLDDDEIYELETVLLSRDEELDRHRASRS
ncbi:MAG: hypothetical protein K8S97_11320 [Anaerolineae bacterium]|nr:hypothetical protein [Anaerolineae bacterium]